MTEQSKLLASIALFTELCDTKTNFKDIINEFIKGVYSYEKVWALNSQEAMAYLKKHFEFEIPEAVVRECLRSLVKTGFLDQTDGRYTIIDKSYDNKILISKIHELTQEQRTFEDELIGFIEDYKNVKLSKNDILQLRDDFLIYLTEGKKQDENITIISYFVMSKSKDSKIIDQLNQLREGLVLITGLKYTTDLSQIGKWNDELSIYLDTEHIFHLHGLNGEVYQRMFLDFYNLIHEINIKSKKNNQRELIKLKYFEETLNEIESFFYVAQKIIQREGNLSASNIAMETICNGCTTVSDVINKKTELLSKLKSLGIQLVEENFNNIDHKYNIVDQGLLDKYKGDFEEADIEKALKSFTKVNYLRKLNNSGTFEKCKHIILTGKVVSLVLSKDIEVRDGYRNIPFVTDIEFLTNRLWFKLNKGLSSDNNHPASLDVLIKAQIILSSQLNKAIDEKYKKLTIDYESKKFVHDEAQSLYYHLREQAKKPEEITSSNVQESLQFIFDNNFDKHLREQSLLKEKVIIGEKAQKELRRRDYIDRKNIKDRYKGFIRFIGFLIYIVLIVAGLMMPYYIYLLLSKIKTDADTKLSIYSTTGFLIIELFGLWRYLKPLDKMIKKNLNKSYLSRIQNIK